MKKPVNCYSVADLAARLETSANTLQRWRTTGTGPEFFRHGMRMIYYPEAAVKEWEDNQSLQRSTAENRDPRRDLGVTQRKRT